MMKSYFSFTTNTQYYIPGEFMDYFNRVESTGNKIYNDSNNHKELNNFEYNCILIEFYKTLNREIDRFNLNMIASLKDKNILNDNKCYIKTYKNIDFASQSHYEILPYTKLFENIIKEYAKKIDIEYEIKDISAYNQKEIILLIEEKKNIVVN